MKNYDVMIVGAGSAGIFDAFEIVFFFFKQKTAYEIYQCDWSSDVCSSDLVQQATLKRLARKCSSQSK